MQRLLVKNRAFYNILVINNWNKNVEVVVTWGEGISHTVSA
jgi:hypothetical protein